MEISKDLLVSHFGCCLILGVSTCTDVVQKLKVVGEFESAVPK